jgi:hypothetical protein
MSSLGVRLIKWSLLVMAIIFIGSFFLVLLAVMLISTVWSLLRGRKPQVAIWWTRYRDMARQMTSGGAWPAQRAPGRAAKQDADVVDVQAREVRDAPRRLPPQD